MDSVPSEAGETPFPVRDRDESRSGAPDRCNLCWRQDVPVRSIDYAEAASTMPYILRWKTPPLCVMCSAREWVAELRQTERRAARDTSEHMPARRREPAMPKDAFLEAYQRLEPYYPGPTRYGLIKALADDLGIHERTVS